MAGFDLAAKDDKKVKVERRYPSRMGQLRRSSTPPPTPSSAPSTPVAAPADYEKLRDDRIKQNIERLRKLGILDLSHQIKSHLQTPLSSAPSCQRRRKRDTTANTSGGQKPPRPSPVRRSSRLQRVNPVNYDEIHAEKAVNTLQEDKEEFYTEEHVKLLGDYKMSWALWVDGFDNNGNRIYDQICGKTCHQCRQKTLGQRTQCSQCMIVQGQFCGDCLFMRYGENVLEALKNPKWICPVCRGICNCSVCRNKKGWRPTNQLYHKAISLGYKSVAHYLVLTNLRQTSSESPGDAKSRSSESPKDAKSRSSESPEDAKSITDNEGAARKLRKRRKV